MKMIWRRSGILICLLWAALLFCVPLFGGGPNVVKRGGKVYRWDAARPVLFSIDRGSLGTLSEEQSISLVMGSIEKWVEIPTAVIDFQAGDRLDRNVTVENYREFFGLGEDEQELRPENPVIFDDNGAIIDDFLGEGSSGAILGFSGIRFMDDDRKEFLSAWVVINGAMFNGFTGIDEAGKVLTHELGHLIGLDHSQGLPENFQDPGPDQQVPLMYPIVNFNSPESPVQDDITWLSWLYPAEGFSSQEESATIRGKALRPTGDPLLGANVIARRIVDGQLSRSGVTSVVSGFLMLEEGEFELPGLLPGEYAVCIEPLNTAFTGGSGTGPYDFRPVNFPRDYFDSAESAEENPGLMQVISVSAGETVDALVITSNEYSRDPGSLGDDDEILYSFPEGFSFPFYGRAYRSVYLSSDGILSFRVGDHPDGSFRSESRFLSGPARIAPLYSDLDPSVFSAEIRAETGTDGEPVTFYWEQVPEYSFPAVSAGNTFSVSLFRNGNIRISYGDINLTPEFSGQHPEGLNAIVGITPGGLESGISTDLSGQAFYSAENGNPVYQAFTGSSFDLENTTIEFNASRSLLLFPFARAGEHEFTGIALTSFGSGPAELDIEARDSEGLILPEMGSNPAWAYLEPGTQFAKLAREVFEAGQASVEELSDAWIRIVTSNPETGGLAQVGNGLGERQTRMDGAAALTVPSRQLFFTRLYHGPSSYPLLSGAAWAPAVTRIAVANPGDQAVEVTMNLYSSDGLSAASEVSFNLDPLGYRALILDEIFSDAPLNINGGYLEVEASGPGVSGFGFIELEDTYIGLNAATPSTDRLLYSAQLAHHATINTSVKIVNPTGREICFTLRAFLASEFSGIEERVSARISLLPSQSFQQDAESLFGLTPDPGRIVTGSIQVVADSPGLVGDVLFGDPSFGAYAALLPLQGRLLNRAVQSHVSNGIIPWDRTQDAFTGLAAFNPGILEATVQVSVFDRNGYPVGDVSRIIEPRGRFSLTLTELIPETGGMSGGFVSIESNRPIVAQQLFGNAALDYLSAVIPWILE